MWDILSFNTFITKYVLVFFYYLFAFLAPLALFVAKGYFLENYPSLHSYFQTKSKMFLLLMLFFYELFLRMFFELLIGYFDMHDYLHTIANKFSSGF